MHPCPRRALLALPALLLVPAAARAAITPEETLAAATAMLRGWANERQAEGARNLLGAAQGVLLAPRLTGGGLIIGGLGGPGLVCARHGDVWSDPVFVSLRAGQIGLLAGAQRIELALMLLTRQALGRLITGALSGAASGSFTLGDIGARATVNGAGEAGIETVGVMVKEGVFAGAAFEAVQVAPDTEQNRRIYGARFVAEGLLERGAGRSRASLALRAALAQATRASFGPLR